MATLFLKRIRRYFQKKYLFGKGLQLTLRDFREFQQQRLSQSDDPFPIGKFHLCVTDRFAQSGEIAPHYFYQDLLVAQKVFLNNPSTHVDVGSRLDGLVAHVAAFRRIEIIDIRPLRAAIPNVKFIQADLLKPLPSELVNYADSVSCLHALEHFGLGRYGDDVVFNGHKNGLENLGLLLKTGGKLYLSVPIGPQRVDFNAHRVFSMKYLLQAFWGKYQIASFFLIDDKNNLFEKAELSPRNINSNFNCNYGCGIFELIKQ